MATDIRLKKSSVAGRIPDSSDLEYGELAINYADEKLYFKNSSNVIKSIGGSGIDSATITTIVDSDYVLNRSSASFPIHNEDSSLSHYEKMSFTVKTDAGGIVVLQPQVTYQDSGGTDVLVDINLSKGVFSDSNPVIDLIDSAYIQARQQLVDSASIIALVDSDYVRARQIRTIDSALAEYRFMDSGEVITLVDSAYVQARSITIDSDYVQLRVPETYLATIIDSDYISDRQAAGTDSSTVINLIQSTVDSSYVAVRSSDGGDVVNGSVTTHTANQFTGDGSTTLFTIDNSISNTAQLYVTINGVLQHTDTYSFSGANVTLDSAPEDGDDVEIRLNNTQSTNVTLRDYQSYFYTPDSATSVFSGQDNRGNSLSYKRGKIEVYLNGSKLVDSDDYTAQNGSQVTILGDAVDSGDTLEIISLQSAAIYDGIIFSVSKDFTTDSADQRVDTFSKTLYRTTKYIVQIEHDSDNKYHSEEILLSHTGTKVGMVTYAQLLLDSNLGTFDAELDGDNCRLLFSPTYTNTSVKVRAIRTGV